MGFEGFHLANPTVVVTPVLPRRVRRLAQIQIEEILFVYEPFDKICEAVQVLVEERVVHLLQIARKDYLCASAASRMVLDIDRPQLLRFIDDQITPGAGSPSPRTGKVLTDILLAIHRAKERAGITKRIDPCQLCHSIQCSLTGKAEL